MPLPLFDCDSCNNCLLVCPNGSFHSLETPPTALANGDFSRELQWVVDGGTCNECNIMPVCRQCHDADNSPTFNYREALKQMRHATGQARTTPGPLPE